MHKTAFGRLNSPHHLRTMDRIDGLAFGPHSLTDADGRWARARSLARKRVIRELTESIASAAARGLPVTTMKRDLANIHERHRGGMRPAV